MIARRGFTLLELAVVLLILALMAGISTIAIASLRTETTPRTTAALERAREAALRGGAPVQVDTPAVVFLPDGRALGASLDPWTGEPRAGGR
ncbi:MAG TPA: prepilin-type N-terminal cleavage/methylation domain-containing protein [Gemmatimonadales bacterium]|jgi:prepilin-type N-terminal cleavage/methylation domain-containing protein|nr:prepilin-type N-terminal cleavage/methylation domain-containing protein [Gemmatimonadales bacterium]